MRKLQEQIINIDNKVNQLYEMIDGLNSEIKKLTADKKQREICPLEKENQILNSISNRRSSITEHKDILEDSNTWEKEDKRIPLVSSEIQIRRLTAQLTAAYNRIAALEEQLLAYRINS